jgi:hypothetical protein
MSVILATQEAEFKEDRGLMPTRANYSRDPISKKLFTKIGLVECLKVKALSSSPSTTKKKERKNSSVKAPA